MDLDRILTDAYGWLADLKKGDEVLVINGTMNGPTIEKVERVTATQVLVGHSRYAKRNGNAVGHYSRFSRRWIRQVTDADRAECFERKIRADIARINWAKVPLTNLLDVLRQIPESE